MFLDIFLNSIDYPVDEYFSNAIQERLAIEEPNPLLVPTNEQVDMVLTDSNYMNDTNQLRRMSRQSSSLAEQGTFIQPSLQAQLLVNPGSVARIIFDVTNLRDQIVLHNFQVTGERSWLQNFGPRR